MIDPPAIIRWRREGHQTTVALAQLLDGTSLTITHPDEYLTTVVEKMNSANVAHLPVVARNDGCLGGYLKLERYYWISSASSYGEIEKLGAPMKSIYDDKQAIAESIGRPPST